MAHYTLVQLKCRDAFVDTPAFPAPFAGLGLPSQKDICILQSLDILITILNSCRKSFFYSTVQDISAVACIRFYQVRTALRVSPKLPVKIEVNLPRNQHPFKAPLHTRRQSTTTFHSEHQGTETYPVPRNVGPKESHTHKPMTSYISAKNSLFLLFILSAPIVPYPNTPDNLNLQPLPRNLLLHTPSLHSPEIPTVLQLLCS
uniref:Uncharacterized protein n=1 Tax=Timema shepardi TaxID=629360 RepID=A0A7R9B7N4_TIMSH|nr:unnamed protein product [Timema shepardi]